jgi:hypothetical protein
MFSAEAAPDTYKYLQLHSFTEPFSDIIAQELEHVELVGGAVQRE